MLNKKEFRAIASLIGTILGAGIFGVPYVLSRVGIWPSIVYFIVMTAIMTLLHLYFGEIVLAIKEKHRFPGFVGAILGHKEKDIAAILGIFGGWLSLVVYIILGGKFLSVIFDRWLVVGDFWWSIIFAVLGALIILGGLSIMAKNEAYMTVLLLLTLLFIIFASVTKINPANFQTILHLEDLFLPYGVIIFALSGLAVIPELEDMVGNGERKSLRRVIIWGTIISALITALFGFAVWGVSGFLTSDEAISGLSVFYGEWIVTVGAIGGFLAVVTSFLPFLMNQAETFRYDYNISKQVSWFLAFGVPVLLFIAGSRNFIQIISLAGGITGGLTGVLVVITYSALLKKKKATLVRYALPVFVATFFFIGAILELSVFNRPVP